MVLVLLLYVVNMGIAESLTSDRQHVAAGAMDGAASAVTRCEDAVWCYGFIFSRKPAATVLWAYMATR